MRSNLNVLDYDIFIFHPHPVGIPVRIPGNRLLLFVTPDGFHGMLAEIQHNLIMPGGQQEDILGYGSIFLAQQRLAAEDQGVGERTSLFPLIFPGTHGGAKRLPSIHLNSFFR